MKGTANARSIVGNGKVALHYGEGSELDLPVKSATEGSAGIEVTKLLSTTGMVTLDPGFVNTAACSSEITYIDGDAGILRYRGYPIEQLAEKSTFLEVSYLLFYGALPTAEQLADFTEKVTHHTLLDEDFKTFFSAFPRTAHPMAVLSSAVSALSSFYPGHLDPHNEADVDLSMIRLLAKLPTLGAYFYKRSIGQPYLYPDNSLTLVENFLRMTFGLPAEDVPGRPGGRQGPGHAVRAARRPRAELLHLHRPGGRLERGERVRQHLGRACTRCPARCTAAPTRPCSTCSRTSATRAAT